MRLRLLPVLIFSFLLQSLLVSGQAPIVKGGKYCDKADGDFDVIPFDGCGSQTVSVRNNVVDGINIGYIFNYDKISDPINPPNPFSYTYDKPGVYTILQVGSKNGSGFALCKQVTIYERQKVNALLEVCGTIAKVTIVDDTMARSYDHIEINWGDGKVNSEWRKGEGLILVHAYTGTISQITIKGIHKAGVSCTGQENILSATSQNIPLDDIKVRRVEMSADGKVSILYKGIEKTETEVFFGEVNNTYKSVEKGSVGGDNGIVMENLNPESQYKVKLVSRDACGGTLLSDEVGTMVLKTSIEKKGNVLEWNRYAYPAAFTGYQLLRDNAPIHGFQSIDDLKWVDEDAICGQTYEYRIVALTNLLRSFSAPKKVTMTSSKPEKITQASVTVTAPNVIRADVTLTGDGLTGTYDLIVERAERGSSEFKQVSLPKNQQTGFEDKTVNTGGQSYCYRFSYENSCPLRSEFSDPVCSILLKQAPSDISWTNDSPFLQGLESYDVIQNESNIGATNTPVGLLTSYPLNLNTQTKSTYTFQIAAHSLAGNLLSFSNIINYTQEFILLIPDAFTPNEDNINERFEVKGLFIKTFKISVFNRWGEVVFQTNDINNSWDGTINSEKAPAGSYVYKVEIADSNDKTFTKSGNFLLIR